MIYLIIAVIIGIGFGFIAGVIFRSYLIKRKMQLFANKYWKRIAHKTEYCKGARDMFIGLMAEFGLQVVEKHKED